METKRLILARFMDFDVTPARVLPWQPNVRFSTNLSFCWKIHRKSILAIICLNFTFSSIFLVNIGHRGIKVHVNKVQYCRAGHNYSIQSCVSLSYHHSPFMVSKILAGLHIVCWADRKTGTYLEPINRPRVKFQKKKEKKRFIICSKCLDEHWPFGELSNRGSANGMV